MKTIAKLTIFFCAILILQLMPSPVYSQVESPRTPILGTLLSDDISNDIELPQPQYDKNGIKKAIIKYNSLQIDTIIYYTPDGKIKYVDKYTYIQIASMGRFVKPSPGEPTSMIYVARYASEIHTPETEPICVFSYTGKRGLEKLTRCVFADGTIINYENGLARNVLKPAGPMLSSEQELMRFEYVRGNNGNIISTIVIYPSGEKEKFEGLADPVDVVLKYMGGMNKGLEKLALEKIKIHEGNIDALKTKKGECDNIGDKFQKLMEEYKALFAQLPDGSSFDPVVLAWSKIDLPFGAAVTKSLAEIAILKEAIEKHDYETIKAHLGVEIKEVGYALKMLETLIKAYSGNIDRIMAQIPLIKAYVEMCGKVKGIGLEDLASRLRIAVGELNIKSFTFDASGQFVLVMMHKDSAKDAGTYTYVIKSTGRDSKDGSTQFIIDTVKYFDGSFDKYNYKQAESYQGVLLKIDTIDQFDKYGVKKATIFYEKNSDKIRRVVHYTKEGKIKYVDMYSYLEARTAMDHNDPSGGYLVISTIIVQRFASEVHTPETDPICTFYLTGKPGQEKLTRCEFSDGKYITYENNLATAVWYGASSKPKLLMKFEYEKDSNGNILSTTVLRTAGDIIMREKYEGLVDPVDVVLKYAQPIYKSTDLALQKDNAEETELGARLSVHAAIEEGAGDAFFTGEMADPNYASYGSKKALEK